MQAAAEPIHGPRQPTGLADHDHRRGARDIRAGAVLKFSEMYFTIQSMMAMSTVNRHCEPGAPPAIAHDASKAAPFCDLIGAVQSFVGRQCMRGGFRGNGSKSGFASKRAKIFCARDQRCQQAMNRPPPAFRRRPPSADRTRRAAACLHHSSTSRSPIFVYSSFSCFYTASYSPALWHRSYSSGTSTRHQCAPGAGVVSV